MKSVKLLDTKLIYRNLLLFYTLTTKYQKEKLRKQSHLPSHQKKVKYLGINLPTEAKDLYSENYKTLRKETEDYPNRWKKKKLCSWIGRINIVKDDHTTQGNLQIQCKPYQIINGSFHRTRTKKV